MFVRGIEPRNGVPGFEYCCTASADVEHEPARQRAVISLGRISDPSETLGSAASLHRSQPSATPIEADRHLHSRYENRMRAATLAGILVLLFLTGLC